MKLRTEYQETLDYIFEKLPMYSRIGDAAYKKDLTNITALCASLDHPQKKFKTIHVGGTNGKGSTTNMLASCLIESGLKVGIYTSPHLIDYRERIKIGNQVVSEEFVIEFVQRTKPLIEDIKPSFFEISVAMAFEFFAIEKVDIAIIEVGLGGRLDSTNIINPILSIITNISKDHTQMLGEEIAQIAFEKAGIIKSKTPVLIGTKDRETQQVFETKADAMSAPIFYADDIAVDQSRDDRLMFRIGAHDFEIPKESWMASYQIQNIKTVLAASYLLNRDWFPENYEALVVRGIVNHHRHTGFAGRWMHFHHHDISIVLECAHNEAGIREALHSLRAMSYSKLRIIFGAVQDKDLSTIISLLPESIDEYILTQADIPRAMPMDRLELLFHNKKVPLHAFAQSKEALEYGIKNTQKGELLLILGSIFLVGEMLNHLNEMNIWKT